MGDRESCEECGRVGEYVIFISRGGSTFFKKLTFFFFFRVLYLIICSVAGLVFILHCLLLSSISFYNDIVMNLFFFSA